ncbi:MAG: DcaP family trimeric outer membrane transporter [Planctomycetota bacterium]
MIFSLLSKVAFFGLLAPLSQAQQTESEGFDLEDRVRALEEALRIQEEELDQLRSRTSPSSGISSTPDSDGSRVEIGRFPDDAIVRTGEFPGSIRLPGLDASVRLGGFVRTDLIHDIDSLGFDEAVSVRTIPLDGSDEDGTSQTRISARSSRINFDVRGNSEYGPIRTFIEADFFGDGDELRSGYQFRLRHAIAGLGDFYVGQWWSAFCDTPALPESIDDGGPLGAPVVRQPAIRWGHERPDGWKLGLSAENPEGDLSFSGESPLASESVPDLIAYVQRRRSSSRLRVAGLARRLESATNQKWVGAVNVSGRIGVPWLNEKDNVSFQGQAGDGFARYLATFAGAGLDGFVDPRGRIEPVGIFAGYIAYQHWWSERWRSSVVASVLELDNPQGVDAETLEAARYLAGNLFWSPIDRITYGVEAIYADRDTVGGSSGSGVRIMATARFTF